MTRPLGQKQLEALMSVASPTVLMLAPGKVERGLVSAGLLIERPKFGPPLPGKPLCGAVCISAAGLRRLADEMDAGRVQNALKHWARVAAERRQAREQSAPSSHITQEH